MSWVAGRVGAFLAGAGVAGIVWACSHTIMQRQTEMPPAESQDVNLVREEILWGAVLQGQNAHTHPVDTWDNALTNLAESVASFERGNKGQRNLALAVTHSDKRTKLHDKISEALTCASVLYLAKKWDNDGLESVLRFRCPEQIYWRSTIESILIASEEYGEIARFEVLCRAAEGAKNEESRQRLMAALARATRGAPGLLPGDQATLVGYRQWYARMQNQLRVNPGYGRNFADAGMLLRGDWEPLFLNRSTKGK